MEIKLGFSSVGYFKSGYSSDPDLCLVEYCFGFGLVLFGLLYEIRDFKFGFHKS